LAAKTVAQGPDREASFVLSNDDPETLSHQEIFWGLQTSIFTLRRSLVETNPSEHLKNCPVAGFDNSSEPQKDSFFILLAV